MAPPFIALDLHEFKQLLDDWFASGTRRRWIDEVHMHHTWRPSHAQYRGYDTIVGMWRVHTRERGWSDIAQHVTIAPDGTIWTGRHWDRPPASSKGTNGTGRRGPFMFEMIGDFDEGRDPFQDPQRETALWVAALVQKCFGLPPETLKFHRDLGSPKSCPGMAVDYGDVLAEVRALHRRELTSQRAARPPLASFAPLVMARTWLETEPSPVPERPGAEPPEKAAARGGVVLDAATLANLRPHVVNLWGGRFSAEGRFQTSSTDLQRIFETIGKRVTMLGDGERLPIVLYAHGGLNSEESGLRIAANQIPWWNANGSYPIHFVWETGLFETLARMIGVQRVVSRDFADRTTDPAIERLVRSLGADRIWAGMKYGAARAFEPDGAGMVFVKGLADCLHKAGGRVSLHAVGHSAGAIFQAYLLPRLVEAAEMPVETVSLLAPAITVEEYKARLDPMVGRDIQRLVIFTMNKDLERADTVAFAYRKSLLYLIREALEPRIGEAILGLEESIRADRDLVSRFGLGGNDGNARSASIVWSRTEADTGRRASQSATHGGFDNDPATMESVMREILNLSDTAPLGELFPPDRENRAPSSAFSPLPALSADGGSAASAPADHVGASRPSGGARRALCIGIDNYPDPADRLGGCVADAQAWAAAFQDLGFTVEMMNDAAATRSAILARLTAMIDSLHPGDVLALQFSGHGTQVPDYDGDEPDGRDEAFCPHDYAQGRLIIDDDFRELFAKLRDGATMTCFFDTCHSGTITRVAVGRTFYGAASQARYVVARSDVVERHAMFRKGQRQSSRGPNAATPNEMPQIVFAACKSDQVALETNGRGDFSSRAVPLLARVGTISNAEFADLVTQAFGSSPRQHPNLDCKERNRQVGFLLPSGGRLAAGGISEASMGRRETAAADFLDAAARLLRP